MSMNFVKLRSVKDQPGGGKTRPDRRRKDLISQEEGRVDQTGGGKI